MTRGFEGEEQVVVGCAALSDGRVQTNHEQLLPLVRFEVVKLGHIFEENFVAEARPAQFEEAATWKYTNR